MMGPTTEPSANGYRTSYLRRTFGVILAVLPFALAVASILSGFEPAFPKAAWGFAILALLLGIVNCWIAFMRPILRKPSHDNQGGVSTPSVVPLIGTIAVIAACLLGFGSGWIGATVLLASLLDTGGVSWFVFSTWTDRSLWDDGFPDPR